VAVIWMSAGEASAVWMRVRPSSSARPEQIREQLHLREGEQFVVIGRGDTVILKSISPPSLSDLSDLLGEARRQARRAGLQQRAVKSAVSKVRRKR
jgi:bifunctional DNA-binding transcriptional regulator/antitoxin component of YhaV-PrlF toxin-antitoxin module